MAPHSSTLAWKIQWVEEPGGLQSMGHKQSDTTQQLILSVGTKHCFAGEENFARLPRSDPLGSISVANA